jgi:hypothetical protein
MLSLLGLFFIVLVSYIVVRVASVALEITGLAEEVANFQALSAFTGTGFTTQETESALSNPTRRNIIKTVIIVGNAGLTTAVASLILTFMGNETTTNFLHFIALILGMILIFLIVSSRHTYVALKKIIYKFLSNYDSLQVHDYHEVLGLGKGFVISRIIIDCESWMVNQELKDLKLDREGTLILSIEKQDQGKRVFHGAPNGKTRIEASDVLTCYGRPEAIKSLSERQSGYIGDKSHEEQCNKLKAVEVLVEHVA